LADVKAQLQGRFGLVNERTRRLLGCDPTDRITDKAAMRAALPPVAPATGTGPAHRWPATDW
jgi:hypothetical protein